VLLVATVVSAHLLATGSAGAESLRLNDYVVIELLYGTMFAAVLLFRNEDFTFVAASFLMFLVPLGYIYNYSAEENVKKLRGRSIVLDEANNERLVSYFARQSHKPIVKYLDLTPGLIDFLSKNYPWFVGNRIQLSSYGGYEFHMAARASYLRRMASTVRAGESLHIMLPDWEWVDRTSAEFVIYQDGYNNDPRLRDVADLTDPARILRLPRNIVVAPLRVGKILPNPTFGGPVQGRYVRIQLGGPEFLSLAEVRVMVRRGAELANAAQGKLATQSSLFGPGQPERAVDGNTDGDFEHGSVTHTLNAELAAKAGISQPNAWWQVDLGASESIESVAVWNRTDGSIERLSDFWVFVSDRAFAANDTPATLQLKPGVQSNHQAVTPRPSVRILAEAPLLTDTALFDNGYLRVLGAPNGGTASSFQPNCATAFDLDLDLSHPARIQYLFWPNERLRFSVSGHGVEPAIRDGLQTVEIPAGHQHLTIRYVNWPLRGFLALYLLYGLAFAAIPIMAAVKRMRRS